MRAALLLILAMIVAGGVAFIAREKVDAPVQQAKEPPVNVLVAKIEIPPGTFIRPDLHLSWVALNREALQAGYILEGSQNLSAFSGAITRNRIMAGEPVTGNKIVKPDDGGFLSAVLMPGMRAVSIPVTPASGNAGFIFPGDRVDIILIHAYAPQGGGQPRNISETIAENVRVLAVDQRFSNDTNEIILAKTATLEVTPKLAEVVNLGMDMGKLSLSLRSAAKAPAVDGSESATPEVKELIQHAPTEPFRMTIIRGSETVQREFLQRSPE